MTPERNAPCPCGSGKKYKRCCGANESGGRSGPDYIAVNRAVAYKGAVGRKREAFCVEYAAFKAAKIGEIQEALEEKLASAEAAVSCSRGCTWCCAQFVAASLQECECIVHYLYRHDKALAHFLRAFPAWRSRIEQIQPRYRRLIELSAKIIPMTATDEDRRLFNEAARFYTEQDNPCPFLAEGACSIYAVRPYVCAGYFSLSPPELCRPAYSGRRQAVHLKISLAGRDMPYFTGSKRRRLISPAPLLVHRILEEGYGALSSVLGLENLRNEVLADPETRAALQTALLRRQ